MRPFSDLPIGRKISRLVVVTSSLVVLLTCAAFVAYEYLSFGRATLDNVTTLSRVIADNSTAALTFKDAAVARELITTLRAEPAIVAAALYDSAGVRLAYYHRNRALPESLTRVPSSGREYGPNRLRVYQPVVHGERRLGTLIVETSLDELQRRFIRYGGIALLILATSSLIAFAVARRLQRRITQPVLELAQTAHAITARGDYTMRAAKYSDDELGALTVAFNRMLDEINQRDTRLGASEERLVSALTASDMGTWRYEPDQHRSIVDENFRRIYGLPPGGEIATEEEMTARIFPDDRTPVWAAFKRALSDGDGTYNFEYRLLRPDQGVRWVRDRGRVLRRADGTVECVTGALVDITDRKEAEQEVQRLNAALEQRVAQRTAELAQANRELEAFTYSVSHDLRGPLRHMTGYAEIIREDSDSQLSDASKSALERIVRAADRLSRLVDSLLNLSRIGRQPLAVEDVKLDEIVDAALRELDAEIKPRRVEWHREPLPTVPGDAALLTVVLVNLLSNALKYTRPRDVAVISIGVRHEAGRNAVFVRDNGVGFDPRFKDKLFGVFERLHNARDFEGTGVGLATVDRIIRKHGGEIRADALPDHGATFYFTLPGL